MPKGVPKKRVTAEPTETENLLKAISGQLGGLSQRLDAMEKKVTEQGAAIPRIIPRIELSKPDVTSGLKGPGEMAAAQQQLPTNPQGHLVRYTPWPEGTLVKLNPSSEAAQTIQGQERGKKFNIQTVGEVVGFHYYSESRGEGKYRVRFTGLTRPRGDGFYESDLLPA